MNKPLLSIVVPTKDRYPYLEKLIELIHGFNEDMIELVIQDNTENNSEILSFLSSHDFKNVVYNHRKDHVPVSLNSDLAILASSGKYVCFIGDDDGVVRNILDYVRWMEENEIDSLRSEPPITYSWPESKGFVIKTAAILKFHIPKGKKKTVTDFHKVRRNILRKGATIQSENPRIYCGIVRRDVLDQVYNATGTYFPGPSPDMASSMALSYYVKKHVIVDDIIVLAGSCPKSGAGMGQQHKHIGRVEEMPWLPKDTSEKWEPRIPKYWTGETIYAESAIKAIRSLKHEEDLRYMSYAYLYAAFFVFHPNEWNLIKSFVGIRNFVPFSWACFKLFATRAIAFLRNVMYVKAKIFKGVRQYEGVDDIIECEKIINNTLH